MVGQNFPEHFLLPFDPTTGLPLESCLELSVCSQSGDLLLSPLVSSRLSLAATPDSALMYCELNNQVTKLVGVVFRDRLQMVV